MAPNGWLGESSATQARDDELTFSGGPNAGQVISGTYTVIASNVANMSYINMQVWNGSAWSDIANITAAPWLTAWDTTPNSDGAHKLRIQGTFLNSSTTGWIESPTFTLDNTPPSGLSFAVANPIIGDGSSTVNRAWFNIAATDSLTFSWSATDTHLSHATLTSVPGSGTPAQDGPGTLLNQWIWSPGDIGEGTWMPLLTVFDEGGLSTQTTLHIGVDRTGPTVGTPTLSETANVWTTAATLIFSGLGSGATDGSGSGIDTYAVRDSSDAWTDIGAGGSGSIPLQEGIRTIQFRATDKVGNIGSSLDFTMKVDRTAPVLGGWNVAELTDSITGQVPISVSASDSNSGIDQTNSRIEYGFDSDGAGAIPDITSSWLNAGSGTSVNLSSSIDWSARAGQYLSLRAVLEDVAGNTITTQEAHFIILPGLDLYWSDTSIDRMVVRAGVEGAVSITGELASNQVFSSPVTVKLQSAPADRDSGTAWTTLATVVTNSGDLIDQTETISINITLLTAGEYDLRLLIDPNDVISEKDEGNNEEFLLISAADPIKVGAVSGFSPDTIAVLLTGLIVGFLLQRRKIG
jgi:hypothetical protein